MSTTVNQSEKLAAIRLLELLSNHSPWHRSLWGIGMILSLDEIVESYTYASQGHLSAPSIKRASSALQKRIGNHPVISASEKKMLQEALASEHPPGSVPAHIVNQLARKINEDYLIRWSNVVNHESFRLELFARSVASHLLDAGFSSQYLHEFVKNYIQSNDPFSLKGLCLELQNELDNSRPRKFEILLALDKKPKSMTNNHANWLSGKGAHDWLVSNNFSTTNIRPAMGIKIEVIARDPHYAAQLARMKSDTYNSRMTLATGQQLHRIPYLWIAGIPKPYDLKHDHRGVAVEELYREDRVFSDDSSNSIGAALELLSHLDTSSPSAAVAGGWGAIEAILAPANDRSSAADNLASIVASSYPRAELTKLAHAIQKENPGKYAELENSTSNRQRSRVAAAMIIEGKMPALTGLSDQSAVIRMQKLFARPKTELNIIQEVLSDSFHRLYRQRNLILHGGKLDNIALIPGLRTVAKITGAGMDRLTHAHYTQNLQPLELVAKAKISLSLLDNQSPLACVDLLEETHTFPT